MKGDVFFEIDEDGNEVMYQRLGSNPAEAEMINTMQVVAGVLFHPYHRDHQLLGQRGSEVAYPGAWEHPGGKVEPGETHHEALAREWLEELGVEVEVSPLPAGHYADPSGSVHVTLYVVSLADPDLPHDWPDRYQKMKGPAHIKFMWADLARVRGLAHFERVPSLKTLAHAVDLLT